MPLQDIEFSLIRPFFRCCGKPFANGILTDILPFLRITVASTQLRVPLVALENGVVGGDFRQRGRCPSHGWYLIGLRHQAFPIPHPALEWTCRECPRRTEEMYMVWHYYVAPYKPRIGFAPRFHNAPMREIVVQGGATSPLPAFPALGGATSSLPFPRHAHGDE